MHGHIGIFFGRSRALCLGFGFGRLGRIDVVSSDDGVGELGNGIYGGVDDFYAVYIAVYDGKLIVFVVITLDIACRAIQTKNISPVISRVGQFSFLSTCESAVPRRIVELGGIGIHVFGRIYAEPVTFHGHVKSLVIVGHSGDIFTHDQDAESTIGGAVGNHLQIDWELRGGCHTESKNQGQFAVFSILRTDIEGQVLHPFVIPV